MKVILLNSTLTILHDSVGENWIAVSVFLKD